MDEYAFEALSPLEQAYWQRLEALFSQVNPQKPEKGILALIRRARALAETEEVDLNSALESVYQGAQERTERRVRLLSQCQRQFPQDPSL